MTFPSVDRFGPPEDVWLPGRVVFNADFDPWVVVAVHEGFGGPDLLVEPHWPEPEMPLQARRWRAADVATVGGFRPLDAYGMPLHQGRVAWYAGLAYVIDAVPVIACGWNEECFRGERKNQMKVIVCRLAQRADPPAQWFVFRPRRILKTPDL